ncbi:MAG: hypothetical protein ACLP8Y_09785 [Thermoplasmata archaeon]
MPSAGRQKSKAKRPPPRSKPSRSAPAKRVARPAPKKKAAPAPKKPVARPVKGSAPKAPPKSKEPAPELQVPLPGGRRHVLSLSFVRDGDEFLARLETDSGHITEFKNRSLDQLLTLVAGELEDLVE